MYKYKTLISIFINYFFFNTKLYSNIINNILYATFELILQRCKKIKKTKKNKVQIKLYKTKLLLHIKLLLLINIKYK
ncbi:hypothetical protein PFAG_02622 [Plasmodium falciparum Santa Lucia]|uniref:Uncharacterized protein n=1 Tax=Plasmodium falciparum Santa Lucia TaxID=478859 RepID=W7FVG9_PLAFA|nr:hypothetical protein PFAG_02622 [Plasmodium falciparum Santa Lucia]